MQSSGSGKASLVWKKFSTIFFIFILKKSTSRYTHPKNSILVLYNTSNTLRLKQNFSVDFCSVWQDNIHCKGKNRAVVVWKKIPCNISTIAVTLRYYRESFLLTSVNGCGIILVWKIKQETNTKSNVYARSWWCRRLKKAIWHCTRSCQSRVLLSTLETLYYQTLAAMSTSCIIEDKNGCRNFARSISGLIDV